MNVSQFFITRKRTNNTNNATHYVKLGKKRRKSSKRNNYIISPRVIIKAIIIMCTLYTYTNIRMSKFSPSGFFGPFRCLILTPGLKTEYPICAVCVRACVYTHVHSHTLPPALKIEKTQTTPLSFILSRITPHAKQQVLS